MEIFTEISNWHLFECVVVVAFVWIGIQLNGIERRLKGISDRIRGTNSHICQIREDRSEQDDDLGFAEISARVHHKEND
jgi:hypothetical protein